MSGDGFVYFIQSYRGGNIKAGWSADPVARLRSLQVGHPDRLVIIGVREGPRSLEADVHRFLKPDHVRGEWFKPGARVKALVARAESAHKLVATKQAGRRANDYNQVHIHQMSKMHERKLRQFERDEAACLRRLRVKRDPVTADGDEWEARWRSRNRSNKRSRIVNHKSGRYHHWASPDSFRRGVT